MGMDCLKKICMNKNEKNKEMELDDQEKQDYTQMNNKNNVQNKKNWEKSKNSKNEIITNKGLSIDCLYEFIKGIFPEDIPNNYIEDIKTKIREIKYIKLDEENKIKNLLIYLNYMI